MAYDINNALERLEENLKNLDSARKQVETTVKASNELLDVVSKYVSSVKELCGRLKVWEDDMRTRGTELGSEVEQAILSINSSCTEIITSFSSKVDGATSAFESGTKGTLDKFVEQNDKLSERVKELNSFKSVIENATKQIDAVKESLEQISKDLKQSQEGQDIMLEDIKQIVSGLPDTIQNGLGSVLQAISDLRKTLGDILGQMNGKIDTINGKTDVLAANITATKNDLTTMVKDTKDEIIQSSKSNRIVLIVGIIIIVLIQLLLKWF